MKHLAQIQIEFLKYAEDDMSGIVHDEIEKRLTLSEIPEEVKDVKPTLICQGVIREIRDKEKLITYARIRMKKEDGKEPVYSMGIKNFPLHQEAETEISKEMFDSFYPKNLDKPQKKLRYSLDNGWDVDVIDNDSDEDEIYAEYEHEKGDKIKIPQHWKIRTTLKGG